MASVRIFFGSIRTIDGYLAISFLIWVVFPESLFPESPIRNGMYSGMSCGKGWFFLGYACSIKSSISSAIYLCSEAIYPFFYTSTCLSSVKYPKKAWFSFGYLASSSDSSFFLFSSSGISYSTKVYSKLFHSEYVKFKLVSSSSATITV